MPELERFDASIPRDPHTELLQALELPPAERRLAIHRAMNAWLAEEGAAAVRTARDDPRLVEVVDVMMQVAMVVDPDIFIEDPSLLEGFGESGQLLASRTEEAIRLGREHGFDRQAVVEMRANSSRERITAAPFIFSSDGAIGFGPRSFAAPSMIMLDDGRGSSGMADGQTDEDR